MTNNWFVRHLGLSSRTVVDWLNFCREVCMVCIQGESSKIGGFGFMVETDESKFVKRKYQRGKARKLMRGLGLGRYLQGNRSSVHAHCKRQKKGNVTGNN